MHEEKGIIALPLLFATIFLCWLSAGLYLVSHNEQDILHDFLIKREILNYCELNLYQIADKFDEIGDFRDMECIFTSQDNKKIVNIYAMKLGDDILLVGEAKEKSIIIRLCLRLVWQEEKNKWKPLRYEF